MARGRVHPAAADGPAVVGVLRHAARGVNRKAATDEGVLDLLARIDVGVLADGAVRTADNSLGRQRLAEPCIENGRRHVAPAAVVRDLHDVRALIQPIVDGVDVGFRKTLGANVGGEQGALVVEDTPLDDAGLIRRGRGRGIIVQRLDTPVLGHCINDGLGAFEDAWDDALLLGVGLRCFLKVGQQSHVACSRRCQDGEVLTDLVALKYRTDRDAATVGDVLELDEVRVLVADVGDQALERPVAVEVVNDLAGI